MNLKVPQRGWIFGTRSGGVRVSPLIIIAPQSNILNASLNVISNRNLPLSLMIHLIASAFTKKKLINILVRRWRGEGALRRDTGLDQFAFQRKFYVCDLLRKTTFS